MTTCHAEPGDVGLTGEERGVAIGDLPSSGLRALHAARRHSASAAPSILPGFAMTFPKGSKVQAATERQ